MATAEYMRMYYHRRKAEGNPLPPGGQASREVKDRYAKSDRGRIASRLKSHRYRARKAGASVEHVSIEYFKTLTTMPCHYCAGPGGEVDHKIPLSKGGRHAMGNLVPSCRSCNARKGDKII